MKIEKYRLEALSDGIIAIAITIMVLNIPLPVKYDFSSILNFLGTIFIYFISFIVVGYFWNSHNRIFTYVETVSSKLVWFNLLFLFFLSLIPVLTKWVIENPNNIVPAIGYDIAYLSVSMMNMVMFRFIIQTSNSKEVERIQEIRKKMIVEEDYLKNRTKFLRRFLLSLVIILAIIIISLIFKFSSYVLVGIPVIFALWNLIVENPRHNSNKNSNIKSK